MTEHSAIGPSALHRLLACPASHNMSKGKDRKSSPYAAEGSVAHEIVEGELSDSLLDERPDLGDVVTYEDYEITVDQDMLDGVDQMVAFCEPLKDSAEKVWVEKRVDLAPLWGGKPPEKIFGTMDFGAYQKDADTLYVVDFKYGRLPVFPYDNPQAFAYGLGACYELGHFPKHVVIVIVQPRGQDNKPVKIAHLSGLDLMVWADDALKPGVDALFSDTAAFATGDHCRFCPAKINCPALYELAKKTSRTEFNELPPNPIEFNGQELSGILDNISVIQSWFEEVRAEASHRIEKNKPVPGWKLVPKRALRKWASKDAAEDLLESVPALWDKKPKSPTQVEKLDPEVYAEAMERGIVEQKSSGTTLAPDHDPRAAVAGKSAKDEFEAIE